MVTHVWETDNIGKLFEFKNGLNKSKQFFGYGTPILNYMDVYKKDGIFCFEISGRVNLTEQEIRRYEIRKGDVFFTRTSETPEEVGMSCVLLDEVKNGVFSGFVLRGRPITNRLDIEYCKYCFQTTAVRQAIVSSCTYTTRALTNGKQLSAIELPIPPRPEQHAVTAALSDADSCIAALEKLVAKKKAIKQGAMQALLTGKRRLPGFTGEWVEKPLRMIGVFSKGSGISRADSNSGRIPCVRYGEIYTVHNDYIKKFYSHISKDVAEKAKRLNEGDLLFTGSGETKEAIGKCVAFVGDFEAYAGGDIIVMSPTSDFDSLFLSFLLNSYAVAMQKAQKGQGDAVVHITAAALADVLLYLPPDKAEQTAIAAVLSDMDAEIEVLTAKLNKMKLIKQGMMQELLTGRIRLVEAESKPERCVP